MPYKENKQLFFFEITIHIGDEFLTVTVTTRIMTFFYTWGLTTKFHVAPLLLKHPKV